MDRSNVSVVCSQTSVMQSDKDAESDRCSTQSSKPFLDSEAKMERTPPSPPPPKRRRQQTHVGTERPSLPERFPMPPPAPKREALTPDQKSEVAANAVQDIAVKKMPHTPAAPPGGKAVVKMPPGMPVAKVGVVDLNSGPFVKAKRQASIDYLSDSDSGESSAPIDAMPKRPPPLKAMPKKQRKKRLPSVISHTGTISTLENVR